MTDEPPNNALTLHVGEGPPGRSARATLNAFLDGRPLGHGDRARATDRWIELSRRDAVALIRELSKTSLAYGVRWRLLTEAQIRDVVSGFSPRARYLSNGWKPGWSASGSQTWDPISDATVDAAVACVDGPNVSVFIVQDED